MGQAKTCHKLSNYITNHYFNKRSKLQFIHCINSPASKTAKIIKRGYYHDIITLQYLHNGLWRYCEFSISQNGLCHLLFLCWISEFANFIDWQGPKESDTHHCAKFCQNRSIHCGNIAIFCFLKMTAAGHLPSWICLGHIWTTHGEYSVVSITVQNLVMIDTVVLII